MPLAPWTSNRSASAEQSLIGHLSAHIGLRDRLLVFSSLIIIGNCVLSGIRMMKMRER